MDWSPIALSEANAGCSCPLAGRVRLPLRDLTAQVRIAVVESAHGNQRQMLEGPEKGQLLLALMEELEGNAHVSFEGNLRSLPLLSYPGASSEPTDALKRNTLWPKQDFVIAPLEPSSGKKIYAALGGVVPRTVRHVQIEKDGVLQFGAYDNFHPECIFFGSAVTSQLLESLVSNHILQPLTESGAKSRRIG